LRFQQPSSAEKRDSQHHYRREVKPGLGTLVIEGKAECFAEIREPVESTSVRLLTGNQNGRSQRQRLGYDREIDAAYAR
jgi:hypothetical protein